MNLEDLTQNFKYCYFRSRCIWLSLLLFANILRENEILCIRIHFLSIFFPNESTGEKLEAWKGGKNHVIKRQIDHVTLALLWIDRKFHNLYAFTICTHFSDCRWPIWRKTLRGIFSNHSLLREQSCKNCFIPWIFHDYSEKCLSKTLETL